MRLSRGLGRVLYLSGAISAQIDHQGHPDVGFLLTPYGGNLPPERRPWAADNGCFTRGYPDVNGARWKKFVHRVQSGTGCLFVAAPDVVGDWSMTLDVWRNGGEELARLFGVPVAIVLQDGARSDSIPWDAIDAVFVGGSTAWKLRSASLIREAIRRGKHAHVGRVNTWRRLVWAYACGADSVDGTHLAHNVSVLLPRLNSWLTRLQLQPQMKLENY